MPKLYIDEDGKTLVYEILEDQATIGRGAANDVQVRDRRSSKHHALIRRVQDRWRLVDLETKNGTRVNGTFRNAWWLRPGDAVAVGDVVVRFDAPTGAVAPVAPAAPAMPAQPIAPAVPAAPARPAAKVAPSRPAASRPATARAAGAPARSSAPAAGRRPTSSRGRPATRGGRRDEEPYEDERPPRSPRRSSNNSMVVLLGGLGAVAFLALMFALMAGGTDTNQDVLVTVDRMAQQNDFKGAIAYIKANGAREENGWARLQGRIDRWEKVIATQELEKQSQIAEDYLKKNIERRTHTTTFRPKDEVVLPNDEVARRLKRFIEEYRGTRPALDIVSDRQGEPWKTYRRILRDHASADADVAEILQTTTTLTRSQAAGRRFGDAIKELEVLKQTQKLMLVPELYHGLAQRADEAILQLQRDADASFKAEMTEVERLLKLGEKAKAEGTLQSIVSTYGIPKLIREAQTKMDGIR